MWFPWETFAGWTVCHVHGQANPRGARLVNGLLPNRRSAQVLAAALNAREAWASAEVA
jgi:hypothetical protein